VGDVVPGRLTALVTLALVVLLSFAPTAQAAITVTDLGFNQEDSTAPFTLTITTTAAAPAGASIIIGSTAIGSDGNPSTTACSDNVGHVYTTDVNLPDPEFGVSAICSTHKIAAALPAGSQLTVTWTGGFSLTKRARAIAVTGLASNPLDRTASSGNDSTSPSSGPGGQTSQAEELLIGLISDFSHNVAGAAFSPGTNGGEGNNNCASGTTTYTALPGVGTSFPPSLFLMYCIVSAIDNYSANATTSSTWQALLATFRALLAPPTIAKAFGAASIFVNGTTTLSFTITNPNAGSQLTGVGFSDTLPSGLVIATPNGLTGSCGGGTIGATAGTTTISLTGAILAGGASCNFSVNVKAVAAGTQNNTTTVVASNEAGAGNAATASINVVALAPPTIAKAFGAASAATNTPVTLTFTVNNPNGGSQLTGVGFTDPLPAGLVVATPNGLTGSCGGGTITATAGSSTISLAGATLAGGTSCNFSVNVTGTTAGTKNNTTSAVTSNEAGTGNVATASINIVGQLPPTIAKAFGAATVVQNGTTTLTFTLTNPNAASALTGVGFTDPLPAGLVVATPNGLTGSCGGGTITATAGAGTISLAGATLAGGASCTFTVSVTATGGGTLTNNTSAVTSTEAGPGNAATASISVVVAAVPTLSALGQALMVLIVVLTALLFLKRRLSVDR
jgi:uncharacterized repeat protein (TIGR01451 family)